MDTTYEAARPASGDVRVARASLCAGPWETPYARAGSGPALLLLADPADPFASSLVDALARTHRVVAPEPPAEARNLAARETARESGDFAGWLRDFLDGLGMTEVPLVTADPHLGAAALAFAMAYPCRVSRLVLLFDDPFGNAGDASRRDRLVEAGQPVLLRAVARPADPGAGRALAVAAAGEISAFLADDGRAPERAP